MHASGEVVQTKNLNFSDLDGVLFNPLGEDGYLNAFTDRMARDIGGEGSMRRVSDGAELTELWLDTRNSLISNFADRTDRQPSGYGDLDEQWRIRQNVPQTLEFDPINVFQRELGIDERAIDDWLGTIEREKLPKRFLLPGGQTLWDRLIASELEAPDEYRAVLLTQGGTRMQRHKIKGSLEDDALERTMVIAGGNKSELIVDSHDRVLDRFMCQIKNEIIAAENISLTEDTKEHLRKLRQLAVERALAVLITGQDDIIELPAEYSHCVQVKSALYVPNELERRGFITSST